MKDYSSLSLPTISLQRDSQHCSYNFITTYTDIYVNPTYIHTYVCFELFNTVNNSSLYGTRGYWIVETFCNNVLIFTGGEGGI